GYREQPVEERGLSSSLESQSDADWSDQLAARDPALFEAIAQDGPEEKLMADEGFTAMLGLVPKDDGRAISSAIAGGLDGEALARELQVKPGTARVRLYRALKRLRAAIESKGGEAWTSLAWRDWPANGLSLNTMRRSSAVTSKRSDVYCRLPN